MIRSVSALKCFIAGALVMSFSGCALWTSGYEPSFKNIQLLRGMRETKEIRVGTFTASHPDEGELSCRHNITIALPWFYTFEGYLEGAFVDELDQVGLYNHKAPAGLTANVDRINLETNTPVHNLLSTFSGGRWTIQVTFTDDQNKSFTVGNLYEYRGSAVGGQTDQEWCISAADAFMPAVQDFFQRVYQTPEFKALIK
jgi:hypothetical protein